MGASDWMIILRMDPFSLYLGINCILHDLSISVPSDLSSRFGTRGSAGEVMRCVGLKTYNRATFHYRIWRRNCKEEQTNEITRYSSRPAQNHTESPADIELAVALSSASIYCNSIRGKQYLLKALGLFNKVLSQTEKRPGTVVILKKTFNLIYFLSWSSIITLFALTVAEWCFNWIAYLFIYLHGFARTTGKPSVPPLMKASISPTNKRKRKHGVCAGLSRSLHRTNFTVCIWIVRGPSVAAARTLMESEC